MNFEVIRLGTVSSTNDEGIVRARRGAAEGLCVIADEQTAGRGRHGRRWLSPRSDGLYISILLRPTIASRSVPLITLMAGVAVCDTLARFGLEADIKWVNDLLAGGRKIAGILSEAFETDDGLAVVVGIGINLDGKPPPEIAEVSTSMAAEGVITARHEVEAALLDRFGYFYENFVRDGGREQILDAWRARSSYFSGKSVRADVDGTSYVGVTDGLDISGALRLRLSDGTVKIITAGDIERLREN